MRFYHIITLALAIICLFGGSGLGAPSKGRYMWVTCKPDGKSANCVKQMGPMIPLSGQRNQLPPSAAKHIVPVGTEEANPESEEQSGEGSGNSDTFPTFLNTDKQWMRDASEQETGSTSDFSGDNDYTEYISTKKIDKLSEQDLKEENIIA